MTPSQYWHFVPIQGYWWPPLVPTDGALGLPCQAAWPCSTSLIPHVQALPHYRQGTGIPYATTNCRIDRPRASSALPIISEDDKQPHILSTQHMLPYPPHPCPTLLTSHMGPNIHRTCVPPYPPNLCPILVSSTFHRSCRCGRAWSQALSPMTASSLCWFLSPPSRTWVC